MEFILCAGASGLLPQPGVALAAARSGRVGLLDLELCPLRGEAGALANLERLVSGTGAGMAVAVRATASQLLARPDIVGRLEGRRHHLFVCGWTREELSRLGRTLSPHGQGTLWVEVLRPEDCPEAEGSGLDFHGWVARGSEAGGFTGAVSAYSFLQLLGGGRRPFLVRGALGVNSVAGCRAAGASGVILDDELLLMQESSLKQEWKNVVRRLGAQDTVEAGRALGLPCRFASRPSLPGGGRLQRAAEEILASAASEEQRREQWARVASEALGWGDPETCAWPVGQGVGLAQSNLERYPSVSALLKSFEYESAGRLEVVSSESPFAPHGALARSHGTTYPIIQGPMTRVSDSVQFAVDIARAGALPMLALALSRYEAARELLGNARTALAGRPWGVGLLGFGRDDILSEQLAAVGEVKPPFALLAGGRPEQVCGLEEMGTATYVHVPAPSLIAKFYGRGCRRLVFEGSECGGHVGPLTSLPLWEQAVQTLLEIVGPGTAHDLHVVFAGGIHDARSAAVAAAVIAPLAARGARVGVLMGTAYLFTEEVVRSGAIVEEFQRQALGCDRTVLLEAGPGHAIRCAPTGFSEEFLAARRSLRQKGLSPSEVARALEGLTVGRARIASKGLDRDGPGLRSVGREEQAGTGMYMMGEAATRRTAVTTLAGLHEEVTSGAAAVLRDSKARGAVRRRGADGEPPVAIIGASCILPKASSPADFWWNILHRVDCVGEIPLERFDWRRYYEPASADADRITSKWGGFVDETAFDPGYFGIPPHSMKSISASQLLALEATRRALQDAGYLEREFDRADTAVIFGATTTADLFHAYVTKSLLNGGAGPSTALALPEWTEESFPGSLTNVIAGRVANRFNFSGPNYTVDAACASSLAALQMGVRELQTDRSSLAVVGAVDFDQTPYSYLSFSSTHALSPDGRCKPFDRGANGIAISEGVVVLVLKRLADAERDGDRVYAVVRSVEAASDGKGAGITAPNSRGQQTALRRAWARAGVGAGRMGLYEAHGTGTVVGDRTELESVTALLAEQEAAPRGCVVSAVKGSLGHTKAAAGMAGVLNAAMALYHQTLPPLTGVERPLPELADAASRLRALNEAEPWLTDEEGPRTAGVSAFGFGGTNFHAVLEGHDEPGVAPCGAARWPYELFALRGADRAELGRQLSLLKNLLEAPQPPDIQDIAYTCALLADERRSLPAALCFVAQGRSDLLARLSEASECLKSASGAHTRGDIFLADDVAPERGANALLFPGQGSQYADMGRELSVYLPEFRHAFGRADRLLRPSLGCELSRLLFVSSLAGEEEVGEREALLRRTDVAQPALAAVTAGFLNLARRVGLDASMLGGHSFGEYSALYAAGGLGLEEYLLLAAARGRAMEGATADGRGSMAAVRARADEVASWLGEADGLVIAGVNAPEQCVVSGPAGAVESFISRVRAAGKTAVTLPVGAGFHSPAMGGAMAALAEELGRANVGPPSVPIHGNVAGRAFPDDPQTIREYLLEQLTRPVDFVAQVESLYEAGARVFVEVGPGAVLTELVKKILDGRRHVSVALDSGGGSLRGLLASLAALTAGGVRLELSALFAGRGLRRLDFARHAEASPRPSWVVNGGGAYSTNSRRPDSPPARRAEEKASPAAREQAAPPTAADAGRRDEGAFAVYKEFQETMRRMLELQGEVTRLALGGAGVAGPPAAGSGPPGDGQPFHTTFNADEPADSAAEPEPAPARGDEAAVDDVQESLPELICRLVSERTGYDADGLNLLSDMEGDLGIDSIKRMEILSSVEAALDGPLGQWVGDNFDALLRCRTLGNLIHTLEKARDAESSPKSEAQPAAAPEADACPRFVPASSVKELRLSEAPVRGTVLITEDGRGISQSLSEMLRLRGVPTRLISRETLLHTDRLLESVGREFADAGPVAGVIHLAPCAPILDELTAATWKREVEIQTKSLFHIAKLMAAENVRAGGRPGRILCASAYGGTFGRDLRARGLAPFGGCHGLLRTLTAEIPDITTRMVDFSQDAPAEEVAARLADELTAGGTESEVGYLGGGARTVFATRPARLDRSAVARGWRPEPGWVLLVTGGSRGITAEVTKRIVREGVTLFVVSRRPLGGGEGLAHPGNGAGRMDGRPSPEKALDEYRRLGADVHYRQADVGDTDAFAKVIGDIYRSHGRIDAVLHGAGVAEDQLIVSKSRASFDRVFDTKANSVFTLARHLDPATLKWVVLFSSVSGRFGNSGQGDYAAANEMMNRTAWHMASRWPSARVVSINWGPWDRVGLVTAPVASMLRKRRMRLISPADGVRFFEEELSFGSRLDVEVVAGAGPWAGAD